MLRIDILQACRLYPLYVDHNPPTRWPKMILEFVFRSNFCFFNLFLNFQFSRTNHCCDLTSLPPPPYFHECVRALIKVVSAANDFWNVIPDFIGDGIGDQEEIMTAICDGIGQVVDGTDCDGDAADTVEVHIKKTDVLQLRLLILESVFMFSSKNVFD